MDRMPEYASVCFVGGQNVFYRCSEDAEWTHVKLRPRKDLRARIQRRRGEDGAPLDTEDEAEEDLTAAEYSQLMDVIDLIRDRVVHRPIVILGFTALNRGITILGPTHEISSRGPAQPMEKDVHGKGRRAGNNKRRLREKGLVHGACCLSVVLLLGYA